MSQRYTIPSLQGTFPKHSMPTLQPNFGKEPFSPSHFNPKIAYPKETKNIASSKDMFLITKRAQYVTCGIKYWCLNNYINLFSQINLCINKSNCKFELTNISYRYSLGNI